jgi:hypothetical protein
VRPARQDQQRLLGLVTGAPGRPWTALNRSTHAGGACTCHSGLLVTELLMTCYLSAELGETLRFPVSGIEYYVPDVQRGQWSPQALVDQAKLRSIENQPGPQG